MLTQTNNSSKHTMERHLCFSSKSIAPHQFFLQCFEATAYKIGYMKLELECSGTIDTGELDEMQRPRTATCPSTNPFPCVALHKRPLTRKTHHSVRSKKRSYAETVGVRHKLDISRVLHHIANYQCSLSFTEDFAPHAHHFVSSNKRSSAEASAFDMRLDNS